jgi:hypothetical chaperone protein
MTLCLGLDFGTTNSAIAATTGGSGVRLAEFASGAGTTRTFRSVLHFDPDERGPARAVAGPAAIARYLEGDCSGRLIQSMKSYLASRLFHATNVFGRVYTLEDLIALVARDLRAAAEAQLGPLPPRIVVGRPVRFAGAEAEDDEAYALGRLSAAVQKAGFGEIVFEYEPVAAAYHYESGLSQDEMVLIADFGGGTSDFCVVRVGPGVRARGRRPDDILGTDGVALAGDAFDSRIMRHVVAPALGRGSTYLSHGKEMSVPSWLHSHLERWHHLSFLKSKETLQLLENIADGAHEPARIRAFIQVVENDLGYQLYRAVERTKVELSVRGSSRFVFRDLPVTIDREVTRAEFESWIAEETQAIADCVDRLLGRAEIGAAQIDRVFMTGGSSLVPAVRRIFESRFGAAKLRTGDELTSVASGLALRARDL